MRYNTGITTSIRKYLFGVRKINDVVSQSDLDNYFYTLNEINGLDKDMTILHGYDLSKYLIPQELKSLIVPSSIKFATGVTYEELKSAKYADNAMVPATPELDEKECASASQSEAGVKVIKQNKFKLQNPEEFEITGREILAAIKKTPQNMMAITDIRAAKTLSDVSKHLCYDGSDNVEATAEAFIPYLISINLVRDRFKTMPVNELVVDWFKAIIRGLL